MNPSRRSLPLSTVLPQKLKCYSLTTNNNLEEACTTRLLQHAVNLILVVQFQHFGRVCGFNAFPVQQESKRGSLNSLSLGVRVKDLLHFGTLLDLEEAFFSGLCCCGGGEEERMGGWSEQA